MGVTVGSQALALGWDSGRILPSEASRVSRAGDLICLALCFLLCEMGLMVPTPCRWEIGEEWVRGGPVVPLDTSYFSQSTVISISPLCRSRYH